MSYHIRVTTASLLAKFGIYHSYLETYERYRQKTNYKSIKHSQFSKKLYALHVKITLLKALKCEFFDIQ